MPDFRAVARQLGQQYNLPFFEAQIQQESGFDPNARSKAGAIGIAQFMPGTASGLGIDPNDPTQALEGAAKLMKSYMDKYHDPAKALAAYNEGEGNLQQYGVYGLPETSNYVKTILGSGAARNGYVAPAQAGAPGSTPQGASMAETPATTPGSGALATLGNALTTFLTPGSGVAGLLGRVGQLSAQAAQGESSPDIAVQAPTVGTSLPKFDMPTMPQPGGGVTAPALTGDSSKFVAVAPNADRQGASIHPEVVNFVGRIGQLMGGPLTITTGTNHNQLVAGTNRESDHWTGWAGDVAYGNGTPDKPDPRLTHLGQEALIAAGAKPDWARKQTGGFYNVNGYNIGFNTMIGGNHFNHLHVGIAH